MLLNTIDDATILLEEDVTATISQKTKGTGCRLESIADILRIIFKESRNLDAKYYREMFVDELFKTNKLKEVQYVILDDCYSDLKSDDSEKDIIPLSLDESSKGAYVGLGKGTNDRIKRKTTYEWFIVSFLC
uniref:Regulator of telomere elongation helicase 1 isoform X2 n=1 Tax=Tanacetum cinerariifolium TaxID=118510 RepID=A0A699KB12_TANCI|nr:regulator of telomere elongation helicase 1 isoform X2 [Tanacetum cinerariifolium]GFA76655.1 regulator of telomere elongation helicase 1 isoform X2 [Tanacetum cinerariifolium]GFA78483.1 regulator of telomere elongation helicase 1 isoform X2 [Tanacetum cinerariifolium]